MNRERQQTSTTPTRDSEGAQDSRGQEDVAERETEQAARKLVERLMPRYRAQSH